MNPQTDTAIYDRIDRLVKEFVSPEETLEGIYTILKERTAGERGYRTVQLDEMMVIMNTTKPSFEEAHFQEHRNTIKYCEFLRLMRLGEPRPE